MARSGTEMVGSDLKKHPVLLIFIFALLLRLAFSFYFQQFYFGRFTFTTADTYTTYLHPFLNWLHHGVYMGDLYLEDSKYYAVPVYPFLLGTMYTLFGPDASLYVMAFLQSVIDSFTTVLVYLVVSRITGQNAMALAASFIYAVYPFTIVWTPISVTEILYTFIAWLLFYASTLKIGSLKTAFLLGALVGIGVLTKQHLGLLLVIPMVMIVLDKDPANTLIKKISLMSLVVLGMVTVLSPWVARNYLQSGTLIVLKGKTVGIRAYGKDFRAFEKFANNFNQNITPLVDEVVQRGTLTLKKHPAFVAKHQKEINEAASLAYRCGPAFVERRMPTRLDEPPRKNGCTGEVVAAFGKLTTAYWHEVPLSQALETRMDAVKKIYLKSDIANKKIKLSKGEIAKKFLFAYRTVLLTLGGVGLVLLLRIAPERSGRNFAAAALLFSLMLYAFVAIVMVHVEMRYLLMADTLISVFASVPLVLFAKKFFIKNQVASA